MCIQEQWFTLAGGAGVWGIEETNVACKQLGFSDGKPILSVHIDRLV